VYFKLSIHFARAHLLKLGQDGICLVDAYCVRILPSNLSINARGAYQKPRRFTHIFYYVL